jgi:HAE1 family hydrophobic/amphiphilic exporter-1
VFDRSQSIVDSVNDVQFTLMIAFVLVVMVIYIFLGRATDTLIPAVALPLSLLLTVAVMYALNYSINNLTLMALTLAIGFLVDDAIVFLENVVRRAEHGESILKACFQQRWRDFRHHHVDDAVAGCGFYSSGVFARFTWSHLS